MARRTLAASVVVTVSLAELACQGQPTKNPPGPSEPGKADGAHVDDAEPPSPNPPDPTNADAGHGEAPPADPPPPDTTVADKPDIVKNDDGTCTQYFHVECDPGDKCNPPPPREVPCPPELDEEPK